MAVQKIKAMFRPGNPHMTALLGRPGSGKTYVLMEAIEWCAKNFIPVVVACPTGRAAVNIAEALPDALRDKVACMTVDKLIKDIQYKPKTSRVPAFVLSRELGGLVIIDEVGMLSSLHYTNLVTRGLESRKNVRFILSGDCDQLPPPSGQPFYANESFLNAVQEGCMWLAELKGNHRNGECKDLLALLEPFRTGSVSLRCKMILEEIARRQLPNFVWLYIAQRHESLHMWNDRKASEVAEQSTLSARVTPAKYPNRLILVASGSGRCEGTRVLITENIYCRDGHMVAVNGECGIVSSVLCNVDKNGNARFSAKDVDAFDVILDRTREPVTILARKIKAPEATDGDDNEFLGVGTGRSSKKSPKWMYVVDIALGYAGTIYTQQGRTILDPEVLVVDWKNMTTESLLVALSRVQKADQLRFVNFVADMDYIARLMNIPKETREKSKFRELLIGIDGLIAHANKKRKIKTMRAKTILTKKRQALGF